MARDVAAYGFAAPACGRDSSRGAVPEHSLPGSSEDGVRLGLALRFDVLPADRHVGTADRPAPPAGPGPPPDLRPSTGRTGASPEVPAPSAHEAASRCPALLAPGRSRSGVPDRRRPARVRPREPPPYRSPLRFSAPVAGGWASARASRAALPGVPSPAALLGFVPSQSHSRPRVAGVSAGRAHLPFPGRPPRWFSSRGWSPEPACASPTSKKRPGQGRPPRLLGFVLAGDPCPAAVLRGGRADTALGFAPLGSSGACGATVRARPRPDHQTPETASGPYPLMGFTAIAIDVWLPSHRAGRPRGRRPFSVLRDWCLADPAPRPAKRPRLDRLPV